MAAALLSPPPSPTTSSLHPRHAFLRSSASTTPPIRSSRTAARERDTDLLGLPGRCWSAVGTGGGRAAPSTGRRRRVALVPCSSSVRGPASGCGGLALERRHLLLSGLVSSFALVLPVSDSNAVAEVDEDVKMATLVDPINAYSFLYPVELPGKKFTFKWVESRKPERYSSAAPLSLSIGPPNSHFLPSKDKSKWDPKDVADWILAEKSSLKVTTGQRMTESSVLDAHSSDVDGEPYWYYEYLVRKSPTQSAPEPNLFRHNIACTAERDGYLYSLNASTLSKQWESMGPSLQKTVASFHLLPPTENYVPPYKDPWRFW